jgi:hypothetical protein
MSASLDKDYKDNDDDKNRWYLYDVAGKEPPFPKIDGAEYLLHHLKQIGLSHSNGMGMSPVSYQEILAYCSLNGLEFTPNEVNTMKDMSVQYCRFVSDKNPSTKSPFVEK